MATSFGFACAQEVLEPPAIEPPVVETPVVEPFPRQSRAEITVAGRAADKPAAQVQQPQAAGPTVAAQSAAGAIGPTGPVAAATANKSTNLTIDATTTRSVGGVSRLDHVKYFNHWGHFNTGTSLDARVTDENAFNSVTGRETFEFDTLVAGGLTQDPANPGLFRDSDLRRELQGRFRNWALNLDRWSSLRQHPNPIFVQSGRAAGNWPGFMFPMEGATLPLADNGAAYAQLLTAYAEAVLFGTENGQGYLPFDPNRHYIEIMNEPQLELNNPFPGAVTWRQVIEMHQNVTETVKAKFPQVKIGGASVGDALTGPHRWSLMREMMEDMTDWEHEFDFWSIHPYECYWVDNVRQPGQLTFHSPAHLNGLMDLFESTSNRLFGEPKQFAVTEYGMWAFTTLEGDGGFNGSGSNFASYTRDERQWDHVRDTKEKLMEFLRRPDRIVNATPFINIQHFTLTSPTEEDGFYYFFDRLANGSYVETIIGGLYRMYNDVDGVYVMCEKDNVNTQATAFLDGREIHILLNNMQRSDNQVDINLNIGTSSVVSAKISRIFFDGTQGIYQDDVDISDSWETVTLRPDEGAVLTLSLDSEVLDCGTRDVETHYANQTEQNIPGNGFVGPFDIPAIDTEDIQKATFRISFSRPAAALGESFTFFINGESIEVAATGDIGYDDDDRGMGSREIEVPIENLADGNKTKSSSILALVAASCWP